MESRYSIFHVVSACLLSLVPHLCYISEFSAFPKGAGVVTITVFPIFSGMVEPTDVILLKFMKFGLVGLTGTALDFGVTYLAKEKLQWNKYLANTTGFVVAVTNNFFLNRFWTFHNHDPEVGWQYSKFMSVALLGLVFHTLLLYLFSDKVKIDFYRSKLGATFIVFVWNFFLNYFFTF